MAEGSRTKKKDADAPDKPEAPTANGADGEEGEKKEAKAPRGSNKYSPISILVVVTPERKNPKRPSSASFERFALYPTTDEGIVVADALKLGIWTGDIGWDHDHGFISIDGVSNPIKERKKPVPTEETIAKRAAAAKVREEKAAVKAKAKADKETAKAAKEAAKAGDAGGPKSGPAKGEGAPAA